MLQIGEFHFDPASRELSGPTSVWRLSPKAAGVLSMLAEAEGQVCSRADILDRVWPCVTVGEEVLTHAIAELRRAFGDNCRAPSYIETVHKKGYRLPRGGRSDSRRRTQTNEVAALSDLEGYAACLEAYDHYDRGGRQSINTAIGLYSFVTERHPRYAKGHAGLAKALIFSGAYYDPDDSKFGRAEEHCSAALGAEANCAEAHAALGLLAAVRGDFSSGWERFRMAIRLAPHLSETHYLLGRTCLAAGEYTLAAAMLERAASLAAEDFHSPVMAGKARLKVGDEAGARANFVRGLKRAEAYLELYPGGYRGVRCRANCLWHLGRTAEAWALAEKLRDHPDPMPYYTASFFALVGENDLALEVLSEAVEGGWSHGAFLASDPDFDPVRGEARFRRIAHNVRPLTL